jgi:hypothetical protein
MKQLLAFLLIACFAISAAFAQTEPGVGMSTTNATSIRSSAILTTSDVLSTTFSLTEPSHVKAIHYYVDFTVGSLTNATFTPAGACDGNPAAAGYYATQDAALTVTASGTYHIRVPVLYDGAPRYHGVFVRGTGTATSSLCAVKYRLEY